MQMPGMVNMSSSHVMMYDGLFVNILFYQFVTVWGGPWDPQNPWQTQSG